MAYVSILETNCMHLNSSSESRHLSIRTRRAWQSINPSSSAASAPAPEELRLSDLDWIGDLGAGGFARVSKARHRHTGAVFALKMSFDADPDMEDEAKVLSRPAGILYGSAYFGPERFPPKAHAGPRGAMAADVWGLGGHRPGALLGPLRRRAGCREGICCGAGAGDLPGEPLRVPEEAEASGELRGARQGGEEGQEEGCNHGSRIMIQKFTFPNSSHHQITFNGQDTNSVCNQEFWFRIISKLPRVAPWVGGGARAARRACSYGSFRFPSPQPDIPASGGAEESTQQSKRSRAQAIATTDHTQAKQRSDSGVALPPSNRPRLPTREAMPRAAPSPTDPPPPSHQHQALFAAVRSGDAVTVRELLVDAEASGASLPALAGEAATYVAAGAEREEVVRLILSLYEFKAAAVSARLDLDTFHLVAMRGWVAPYHPTALSGLEPGGRGRS
ncbi:hypothetical protein C2845_PM12G26520 [Panicum miliaceum]|uniref:Protein kinase domain-containing protein n=1 Tax=Panicum miliaceum TaxID=4540 RepID=A0A3L6QIU3_PANMI|nr:hypothetical protein C2845_PM12G26520 [Panicum miliaceum]